MDLTKLFETQEVLDERIIKERGLEGRDLLPEKILALLTELGELSNEWRGFKFWSEKNKPVVRANNPIEHGNPMLEEYVDCLHFILSIGLHIRMEDVKPLAFKYENIMVQFIELFADIAKSYEAIGAWSVFDTENNYLDIICEFIGLGEMLGFTWDEIETAYFAKNKINHTRQDMGY